MKKTINDIFPEWLSGKGFFEYLSNIECPPEWLSDVSDLSLEYHGNRSGSKLISPLVEKLLNTNGVLPESNINKLVTLLWNKFGKKWENLFNTLSLEYNPIENYDRYENEKPAEITITDTPAEITQIQNTDSDIFGFNSTESSPSNKSETENSVTVDTSGITKHTTDTERIAHIHGNIGVTTAPQMLTEYYSLQNSWNFFDNIFSDIDSLLTLQIY